MQNLLPFGVAHAPAGKLSIAGDRADEDRGAALCFEGHHRQFGSGGGDVQCCSALRVGENVCDDGLVLDGVAIEKEFFVPPSPKDRWSATAARFVDVADHERFQEVTLFRRESLSIEFGLSDVRELGHDLSKSTEEALFSEPPTCDESHIVHSIVEGRVRLYIRIREFADDGAVGLGDVEDRVAAKFGP